MKKLRQAEKRNQTPVVPDTQKSEFVRVECIAIHLEEYKTEAVKRPVVQSLHTHEFHQIIFHPPIFSI